MDINGVFTKLVNSLAPPWPDALGGEKVRAKINATLAPQLLNTWLPPLPRGLANNKTVQAISPKNATTGPPLPAGLNVSWPSFFTRSINRLSTEGVKGPYKTIKDKGLMAEIKRELGIVTGVK